MLRRGVVSTLPLALFALGPTAEELTVACEGVAPGRPKDDCTLKRLQDTNAKAATCFEQTPGNETAYHRCTDRFCVEQGKVCSGPGGPESCKKQCKEYGYSQFVNLKALVDLPGAQWQKTGADASLLSHGPKLNKALAQSRTTHARPPYPFELKSACAGVGAGTATSKCTTTRMRDTNARAAECFTSSPGDESAFKKCCDSFCMVQSKVCTGHGGQYVCRRQCEESGYKQFVNLKALATMPQFKDLTSTPSPSTTTTTTTAKPVPAVIDHVSDGEVQAACSKETSDHTSADCLQLRNRQTKLKAEKCYERFSDKAKYQECCTHFCEKMGQFCVGDGESSRCFSQCVQHAHPLFSSLKKAHSAVPAKRLRSTALAQKPHPVKKLGKAKWHHPMSMNDQRPHDPADVVRMHPRE